MEFFSGIVDVFLHLDKHLTDIISEYGTWTYLILFLVIFIETGVVVMPFLPGDSLLFAAGALAANPENGLNIVLLMGLLFVAAFLGDTLNYTIGDFIGPKVFNRDYRFLKREYLLQTQAFYEKHGGKTIIFARFIPIIRTFAPFIAGVGTMKYGKFISYNLVGGFLWVVTFSMIGYFFGNLPAVKSNFTLVVFAIILLSIMPPVFEFLKHKFARKPANSNQL